MIINWKHTIPYLFVIVIALMPLFYDLGKAPISMWDEARYATNALHFYEHPSDLLVVKHNSLPDLYNTKPPFVIWLQSASMSVFGISEWSIRFPSAIFGLFTCLLLFHFCLQLFKSKYIGFMSVLLLLGCSGYVSKHVTRTGDLDAVLSFFLFLSFYSVYKLVSNEHNENVPYRYFIYLFLSLFLGFMSKGIAGFFFTPVIIALAVLSNLPLRNKIIVLSIIFISVVFSFSYYLIREKLAVGYLQQVLDTEIMRITQSKMSWQEHGFDFYFKLLFFQQFKAGVILFLIGFVFVVFRKRNFILLWSGIAVLFYLLLISSISNKLIWYTAPLFPMACLLSVSCLNEIIQFCKTKSWYSKLKIPLYFLMYIALTIPVIQNVNNFKINEKEIYSMEREGAFVRKLIEEGNTFDTLYVVKQVDNEIHLDQLRFYEFRYKSENKLKSIQICQELPVKKGSNVLLNKEIKQIIKLDEYQIKRDWYYMQWLVKH